MTVFIAIVGVLGISASGPIIAAFPAVPVLAMAFWRNMAGAAFLFVPSATRERKTLRQVGVREWKFAVIAGALLALHFVCFMYSVRMTSVAAATALVCIQGVWIAILQSLRGTKYGTQVKIGIVVSIIGAVVITGMDWGTSREALAGDLLALLGGIFAAGYTLAGSVARRTMTTSVYSCTCYSVTAVILLGFCLISGVELWNFGIEGWWGVILLTFCSQLLGHTLMNNLLQRLGALTVSTLVLLEIPGAAILAAIIIGQGLRAGIVLGLITILTGLVLVIRGQPKLEANA